MIITFSPTMDRQVEPINRHVRCHASVGRVHVSRQAYHSDGVSGSTNEHHRRLTPLTRIRSSHSAVDGFTAATPCQEVLRFAIGRRSHPAGSGFLRFKNVGMGLREGLQKRLASESLRSWPQLSGSRSEPVRPVGVGVSLAEAVLQKMFQVFSEMTISIFQPNLFWYREEIEKFSGRCHAWFFARLPFLSLPFPSWPGSILGARADVVNAIRILTR